jgi:D-sedoheptulose 7-phosphate isomerase
MDQIIEKSLTGHKEALEMLAKNSQIIKDIADTCVASLKKGGKIIFMGNGGSAADSQHLAAELVGRFKKNRAALAAISLTVNTSILTCIGNDFGFDEVFSRQIEALARPQDVVIGISTSGRSANVIKAIKKAKELGSKTVGFMGSGGDLASIVDIALKIYSLETPRVQEMHILAGHMICEMIEDSMQQ